MKDPKPNPGEGSGVSSLLRGQIETSASGKIKAPHNIITSVEAARAIYYRFRSDHLKRIQLYAQIEGLFAGNPPYNPIELAKMGLSHIANYNNLDGRSLYERGALAYWNLLNSTERLIKFQIHAEDPQIVKYADIMARHWDFVVRKWPSFYTLVNTLCAQIVKFGLSPATWPDERDWRWRVIELAKFFVADQATTDIEQTTCVAVETTFTAQYLFEVYNQFKDEKKDDTPWNMDALEKLLVYRANSWAGRGDRAFMDAMDVQVRIQNGDFTWDDVYSDDIRIVSLLYREYDGKISHYMFDRLYETGEFLFFEDRQYGCFLDAIVIFTASPGEFTLHSNRGLGHKVFSGVQAMMQLDCSIIDAARWSTTPLLRSLATGTKDFETIRFYPGAPTNIGSAEFVENTMGANISQLIGASQYVLSKLQFNTANSGDDPGQPDRNQGSISPTQARSRSFKEFSVLKHNIAHFYNQFDIVYRNMVVKMLHSKSGYPGYDTAKEWKDRCIEEGVPKELFETGKVDEFGMPRFLSCQASRVAGDGSNLARIMGLESLTPIAGNFGPKGQKEFERQWVMATLGPEYVPAFVSDSDEADERAGGASLAGVENNGMRLGQSPVFSMDNEHQAHVVTHMALLNQTIVELRQQQNSPVEADKIFTVAVPHTSEHLQALSKSIFAQGFLERVKKPWKDIVEYASFNRKNATQMVQAEIRKRQEEEQKTQQTLSDEQRKDLVVQKDIERKDFQSKSKEARAQQQSETRAEVMREKVEKDAENQRLKIELESGIKQKEIDQKEKPLEDTTTEELRSDLENMYGDNPAALDFEGPPQ